VESTGQSMAMGERPISALINPAASARMAVGEALTNLVAANVVDISTVRLSANWMANAASDGSALYEAVEAVGIDLCPKLGISIPVSQNRSNILQVGKDSMSMKTRWGQDGKSVISPVSLVVTAYGPVDSVFFLLLIFLDSQDTDS
jgi:phosphoribosylformylglycinamidine synthase